ncbi:PREDICTED: ankyrin repeat domain-containing protein SOWAHC [Gekko japonicus]|uniref:Ankyrin repeat domain-containing protein SOWAHC n=1 Tax=Gekko japonicus TaxID=146911 RepID=A0ABM1KRP0_GEKJA|nr:PREDICTED: ankyrin repeat domain-containing protein SOWAHC [Gekko japonicus]
MAAPPELQQDAVLRFLAERGGRARNADLLDHFRGFLNSPDPQRRARARERFKEMVNAVAIVKQEPGSGAKYVQLRKKYRGGAAGPKPEEEEEEAAASALANGAVVTAADPEPATEEPRLSPERNCGGRDGERAAAADGPTQREPEALPSPGAEAPQLWLSGGGGEELRRSPQQQQPPPGRREEGEEEEAPPEDSSPRLAAPPPFGALPAAAAATPRCGRKNFRERMMGASPQLKRGGGGGLPRVGGGRERDSDSASLASSSAEEESNSSGGGSTSGSVALDPLEHAWMLCASDGRWESLEGLLSCEPALLAKRDFITGFTCLHWAAKHGRHELLALLVNFAHRHRLPVNINARTSGGYTALHLAAMHGHLEVVKLLVGAYDADVEVRDYSGRKASHYLARGTADQVRGLVGALQDDEEDGGTANGGGRWRLSKVLPANLITYKLSAHLHHGEDGEPGDGSAGQGGKGKDLSRKSSAGSCRTKPRLNKIRFRTQIIHTTPSFRGDPEEEDGGPEEKPLKSSFKLRPKSNVFG